jgi:quercetin dioxygenase-like cupin family protein
MKGRRVLAMLGGIGALALAFGTGVAVGQNAPSAQTGVSVSPATALDLGPEIDGVEGRQLRLRVVTFEPGGGIPVHSHKGRPGVAYMLSGTLTEHIEGVGTHVHKAGESWTEGKDTNHWAENAGDKPAVVVAVDVFKP